MAGRELSTAAVLFHSVLAAKQGLGATDEKTMDLVQRFGPMTAGELAERSGLAPASVTGVIGRLEAKGAVRRIPHPDDGRKVLVELDPGFLTGNVHLFDGLLRHLDNVYEGFTDDELGVVVRFLTEAAAGQMAATRELSEQ